MAFQQPSDPHHGERQEENEQAAVPGLPEILCSNAHAHNSLGVLTPLYPRIETHIYADISPQCGRLGKIMLPSVA